MTKRVALIDRDGQVANVALFPSDFAAETWDGFAAVPLAAAGRVGPRWWRETDGSWTPPAPAA